jgi:hypothetical protein
MEIILIHCWRRSFVDDDSSTKGENLSRDVLYINQTIIGGGSDRYVTVPK